MADFVKVNKGESLKPDVWQALADQHGGSKGESTPQNVSEEYVTGSGVGRNIDLAQKGYDQHPVYRYFFADGSYIDARRTSDDGDYAIFEYKPSDTFTTARKKTENPSASNTQADQDLDAEKKREREWNRDNGGLYETHAERKTREAREAAEARAVQTAERAQRTEQRQIATQEDTNKRGWAEIALREKTEGRLGAEQEAKLRNGEVVTLKDGRMVQIQNDPATGAAKLTDVTPQVGATPKELEGWTPNLQTKGLGLFERQQQLDQARRDGLINDQQYKDILERDRASTATWLDQVKGIAGVQKDNYQQDSSNFSTQSTNYRQRLSTGQDALQQGRTLFSESLPYTGGEAAAQMASAFLRISEKFLDRMAGEEPTAPVKGAMIGEINKMGPLGASGVMPALQGYAQPQAQQAAPTEGGVNPALAQSAAGPDAAESFDMRGHNDAMEQSGQYSPEAMAIWRARTEGAPTSDAPLSWEPAA